MHTIITAREFDRLLSINLDLYSIFKTFLFYSVNEFTENLYNFHNEITQVQGTETPIYLAIVDSIRNRNQSRSNLIMLNRILRSIEN